MALLSVVTDVDDCEEHPASALWRAAYKGHVSVVKELLLAGADVNDYIKGLHCTALEAALKHDFFIGIETMVVAGADITKGQPLYLTGNETSGESPSLRLTNGQRNTTLHISASEWNTRLVTQLLRAGVQVQLPPDYPTARSALEVAAEEGLLEMCDALLKAGANVNEISADMNVRTSLQAAAHAGKRELVDLLLHAGADANVVKGERTAYMEAVLHRDLPMIYSLLDAGANARWACEYELSVLSSLAKSGREDIVDRLLEAGVDVHAMPRGGETALEMAIACRKWKIVRSLLDAGATFPTRRVELHQNLKLAEQAARTAGFPEVADGLIRARVETYPE
jgi:ankyrin repeat protein